MSNPPLRKLLFVNGTRGYLPKDITGFLLYYYWCRYHCNRGCEGSL